MFFRTFFLLCSLAFTAKPVGAQVTKLPEDLDQNLVLNSETALALLKLSFFNRGLAGGDTGVCLDFTQEDGKQRTKVGMDTSAFLTGSSELRSAASYQKNMKTLLHALAKAEGKAIFASVQAYADGQHFKNAKSVKESIQQNRLLSKKRAVTIARLFTGDSRVKISKTEGFASETLEKFFDDLKHGLKCDARRKVVISIETHENQIQMEGSGNFQLTPDSFSNSLSVASRKVATDAIDLALTEYPKGNSQKRINSVYQKLIDSGQLSASCDQFPLKQLTQGLIRSRLLNQKDSKKALFKNFTEYLELKKSNGSYFLSDPDTARRVQLNPFAKGIPIIAYACFNPNEKWEKALQNFHQQTGNSVFLSGAQLLDSTGGSQLTDDSVIELGIDPSHLKESRVGGNRAYGGTRIGTRQRGFFCNACGHGFFFENSTSVEEKPIFIRCLMTALFNPEATVKIQLRKR